MVFSFNERCFSLLPATLSLTFAYPKKNKGKATTTQTIAAIKYVHFKSKDSVDKACAVPSPYCALTLSVIELVI